MKNLYLTMALLSALVAPLALAEEPQAILDAVDKIRAPGENFGFSLKVDNVRADGETRSFGFTVRVKDKVKSLVTYVAPPTADGKRLLLVGQDMWIYVPGTRRAIRISPQQQLLGQVSNADVARVVYSIDYAASAAAPYKLPDGNGYRLTLTAKSKDSPYQRIELVVAKPDYRPLQAEFYALSGRLLKTTYYQDYRSVAGKMRPMRLVVEDAINKSDRTTLNYSDLREMQTPDEYFQKDYLPRLN